MHLAQKLQMNTQCSGGSRSLAKEMRALKMRRIVASHWKVTTTNWEDREAPPKALPKAKPAPKKSNGHWWSAARVAHYSFLNPWQNQYIREVCSATWSYHFMGSGWGNSGNNVRLFFWAPKSLQMVTAAMKLKDTYSWKQSYDQPR